MENKKRLIFADDIKEKRTVLWDPALGYSDCVLIEDIDEAPAVDAVEVVHGRWEKDEPPKHYIFIGVDVIYRCSECNNRFVHDTHYCPNCGAKMDGGKK